MKSNLNPEQSLGLAVAFLATMQSGLGILGGWGNVRDVHQTRFCFGRGGMSQPLEINGSPATRVDVFGQIGGKSQKVSVWIPQDKTVIKWVNIHGVAQWNWSIQDGQIVLSNELKY